MLPKKIGGCVTPYRDNSKVNMGGSDTEAIDLSPGCRPFGTKKPLRVGLSDSGKLTTLQLDACVFHSW